ncbi:MAG: hypothetical protein JNK03_15255, partial [Nitrospira sp.]|nr:hypothetical protein [Nitrospira sp.]
MMLKIRVDMFGGVAAMGLLAWVLIASPQVAAGKDGRGGSHGDVRYELWASDQSNTVVGKGALGIDGSLLWIWDNKTIEKQVDGGRSAAPMPCAGTAAPCDTNLVFPAGLSEYNEFNAFTGNMRPPAGRLHSAFIDPQQKYALLSFFAPGGGM